jgi:hypothetical protein
VFLERSVERKIGGSMIESEIVKIVEAIEKRLGYPFGSHKRVNSNAP